MSLKQYVIDKIKPDDYYATRFSRWNPRIRGNVCCPFHGDREPSLAVSLRNGGARCHAAGCGERFGNIIHFEATHKRITEKIAARNLYQEFIRPVLSKKVLQEYKTNLATNQLYLIKIKKEMGLTTQSIRQFGLGLDLKSNRITIPIYDQFEQLVNIRFYRLPSERKSNEIKIYNLEGYGKLDLFPYPNFDNVEVGAPVYFMAGEKDCMLAIQEGLAAFTCTNGEGAWNPDWNILFQDHPILISFDRDEAGRKAAERLVLQFVSSGITAKTIAIPFKSNRPDRKDFTDFILKDRGTVKEMVQPVLQSLQKRAINGGTSSPSVPTLEQHWNDGTEGGKYAKTATDARPYPQLPEFYSEGSVELAAISSHSELLNKRIRSQGVVAAKATITYSIPWKFHVTTRQRSFDYELPMGRELLRLTKASDTQVLHLLQKLVGSNSAEITPLEYLTATEVEVIPTAVVDKDVPYVVQRCIYFGSRIESNVPYYLEIIPTSEIRTQETIGIITHCTPLSRSIERFELTPEKIATLSSFWPEGEGVWKKLKSLSNEISHHITHVYNRLDWHIVALLTWCSPIGYRFPGDSELQRGWLNSLALGDTQTGKSQVAKTLRAAFNCGVFVSSENCTYVGLVGGAIKGGNGQLMLRWGRIPLSDKQLVILEELSGLSIEQISSMSDLRSSGIARLDKGGINTETNSRTRLLCLSNVRAERRNLSNYLSGVHAVRELIGHGEDIARFDLITTLTDKEVSNEVINSLNFATVAKTITVDHLQLLVQYIWSLAPEQIKFTQEAYEECLNQTKVLAVEYHPSIPIFKGGSGRHKLARIAAAIACLQFSYIKGFDGITITKEHVAAATKLLRLLYNKPSLGYRQYSEQMFDRENIKDSKLLENSILETIPKARLSKVLETIIHSTRFTRDEFTAIAGINSLYADKLIGTMVRERAVRKGEANLWEIEPAGKSFLEKLMKKYERYTSLRVSKPSKALHKSSVRRRVHSNH